MKLKNISLFLIIGLLSMSCWKKTQKMQLIKLTSIESIVLDNSLDSPQLPINDTVNGNALEILLQLNHIDDDSFIYGKLKKDLYRASYYIDSISITSDKDFNDEYPAGTNLKNLFAIYKDFEYSGLEKYFFRDRKIIVEEPSSSDDRKELSRVLLMHPPSSEGVYTFTIQLFTDNEGVFETISPSIFIKL